MSSSQSSQRIQYFSNISEISTTKENSNNQYNKSNINNENELTQINYQEANLLTTPTKSTSSRPKLKIITLDKLKNQKKKKNDDSLIDSEDEEEEKEKEICKKKKKRKNVSPVGGKLSSLILKNKKQNYKIKGASPITLKRNNDYSIIMKLYNNSIMNSKTNNNYLMYKNNLHNCNYNNNYKNNFMNCTNVNNKTNNNVNRNKGNLARNEGHATFDKIDKFNIKEIGEIENIDNVESHIQKIVPLYKRQRNDLTPVKSKNIFVKKILLNNNNESAKTLTSNNSSNNIMKKTNSNNFIYKKVINKKSNNCCMFNKIQNTDNNNSQLYTKATSRINKYTTNIEEIIKIQSIYRGYKLRKNINTRSKKFKCYLFTKSIKKIFSYKYKILIMAKLKLLITSYRNRKIKFPNKIIINQNKKINKNLKLSDYNSNQNEEEVNYKYKYNKQIYNNNCTTINNNYFTNNPNNDLNIFSPISTISNNNIIYHKKLNKNCNIIQIKKKLTNIILNKSRKNNKILNYYFNKLFKNGMKIEYLHKSRINLLKNLFIKLDIKRLNRLKNIFNLFYINGIKLQFGNKKNKIKSEGITKKYFERMVRMIIVHRFINKCINIKLKRKKLYNLVLKKDTKKKEFLRKKFSKFYYKGIYKLMLGEKNKEKLNRSNTIIESKNNKLIDDNNILPNPININRSVIEYIPNEIKNNDLNIKIDNNIKNESIFKEGVDINLNNIKNESISKEDVDVNLNTNAHETKLKCKNLRKILAKKKKDKNENLHKYFKQFYLNGIICKLRNIKENKEVFKINDNNDQVILQNKKKLTFENFNEHTYISELLKNQIYLFNRKYLLLTKKYFEYWTLITRLLNISEENNAHKNKKKRKFKKKKTMDKTKKNYDLPRPINKVTDSIISDVPNDIGNEILLNKNPESNL